MHRKCWQHYIKWVCRHITQHSTQKTEFKITGYRRDLSATLLIWKQYFSNYEEEKVHASPGNLESPVGMRVSSWRQRSIFFKDFRKKYRITVVDVIMSPQLIILLSIWCQLQTLVGMVQDAHCLRPMDKDYSPWRASK